MKTKWVIHKFNSYTPSWTTTTYLFSPFKIHKTHQNPSSKASTFVLNRLDISLLLSICGREGLLRLGCSLHASVIKTHEFLSPQRETNFVNSIVVWNSILSMYTKCRVLGDAVKVFEDVPVKDTVTWNTMISGFLRIGEVEEGFGYLKRMRESGFCGLDQATLTTVLSACDMPETSFVNRVIHCLVFVSGFEREITVGNALITSYFRCGCCSSGRQVFDEMHDRNVVSWTAIISGLAQSELYVDSLRFFMMMTCGNVEPNALTYSSALMACSGLPFLGGGRQIHGLVWKLGIQSDLCIESALMDVYSKCGSMEDALRIFESARELDEVSLTVILVGFAQNGYEEEAVQIFLKMLKAGIEIDPNMVSAVLGVFGVDTSMGLGQQIHSLVIKRDFGSNAFVGNGLINMYSKCGNLQDSIKIFSQMPWRNSVSWNSMIAAFARHGNGHRTLQLYEEMRLEGVEPTDVTFLSLLHACSHVGLVEKGMEFLKLMTDVHGISPRMEHYACVVDMLGRAGHLDEAKSFIEGLSVDPDMLVWQALLGACGIHEDTEMGKYAAEQLVLLSPEKPAPYVLLANIYSSKGRWKERAKIIKKMKETGVTKETGISWIEIENRIHSFVARDRIHPQAETINEVLEDLFILMIDEGYDPEKGFILYSSDREEQR